MSPSACVTPNPIRWPWSDHSNYLIWFEVGRGGLRRSLGFDYKSMEAEDDTDMVVADAHCRYHYPACYDELLTIRTRILERSAGP